MAPSRPKYLAIHEDMRQQILDGRLGPGVQLAAQHDLAVSFGVTLMTLRQAMAQLEADGLIWVSRGRGSFVVDQPVSVRIGNLTSFAEQMQVQGLELTTDVLFIGPPTDAAAARQALDLPRARLVEIQRVRRVGGRPVVLQRTILAASLAKEIDQAALAETSLYELIAATSGRRVARALETLRAVSLSPSDAEILEQTAGAPAIESVRASLTVDNTP
ncbi:MAG: GntR family transcriptional regulator, partial [Actinomycetota bacterium]|nr:GntR family transcriptional regulator [Actinomycetota bacterium]